MMSAGPVLPNATGLVYPTLFQLHESFVGQASLFLWTRKSSMERPDRTRASSADVLLPARNNESKT
jgi:hypothetical protein